MSKDVISVDGEDVVVREDTAKAFRGVNWAIASIIGFVVIAAIIFFIFFVRSASDGDLKTPAQTTNSAAGQGSNSGSR
jgi:hypothetical protein